MTFMENGYIPAIEPEGFGYRRDILADGSAHVLVIMDKGSFLVSLHYLRGDEGVGSHPIPCEDADEALDIGQKLNIAFAFSGLLVEEYGEDKIFDVVMKNLEQQYDHPGACASREMGNADELMEKAWEKIFGEPVTPADHAVRSLAWDVAKGDAFYAPISVGRNIDEDAQVIVSRGDLLRIHPSDRNQWYVTVHWDDDQKAHVAPYNCYTLKEAMAVSYGAELAFTFSQLLKRSFGPEKLSTVSRAEAAPVMSDAWGRMAWSSADLDRGQRLDLWKFVWKVAKRVKFYTKPNMKRAAA